MGSTWLCDEVEIAGDEALGTLIGWICQLLLDSHGQFQSRAAYSRASDRINRSS